ncbi:MAG: hypothetical protein ABIX37_11510 [Gammaproteobacteria bacterium]
MPSLLWLIGAVIGFVPAGLDVLAGHPGLRGIGSLAVAGCLLAAIGALER